MSGPAWWRISFVKLFLDRSYNIVAVDRCVLVLPGEEEGAPTEGLAVLEMDGVLEGGNERHDAILEEIVAKLTFGKIKEVAQFRE